MEVQLQTDSKIIYLKDISNNKPVCTLTVMIWEASAGLAILLTGYRSGCKENISTCTTSWGLIPCCSSVSWFLRTVPKNEIKL